MIDDSVMHEMNHVYYGYMMLSTYVSENDPSLGALGAFPSPLASLAANM